MLLKNTITILASLFIFNAIASAQSNIAAARLMPLTSTVTIRGVVTNGSELGTIRYIQDATAGIALYDAALSSVQRGDSIVATGTLKDYNNLLEVSPIASFSVITTSNPLPVAQLITPSQLGESLEGELVRVDNAVFQNTGTFAGNTSYNFTSNSQTGVVFVRSGSPLVGQLIPTSTATLYGIASQYLTTYQLLPRDAADIVSNSSISITTLPVQTNSTTSGFNVSWNTNISGSTYINYGRTTSFELGTIIGASGISHTVTISGANPADIFYVKAYSVNGVDTAFSAMQAFATVSASTGNIKVYFNKSVDTLVSTGTNAITLYYAIDDTLISYINRAKYSIDIAIYSFDNANISNISTALNNAFTNGVKIRVISEGGNANAGLASLNPGIYKLASPTTAAYGIMHNKFMVIDALSASPNDALVWTGSTNWTDNQINTDANNVIIFQDQSIAKGYKIEFEEMWGDTDLTPNSSAARFGPYKINNTPHEYIIGGIRVESYFSPSDGINPKILEKINSANTDLCIETMLVTRTDLAYAITGASSSGIKTYMLVNDTTQTTVWPILKAGLPQGNLTYYVASGIMHNKYMIVDPSNINSDPMAWTGSHNWSNAADSKNDENTVVVHDATIANIYYQEFVPRFTQNGGILSATEISKNNISMLVYPNPSNEVCHIRYQIAQPENILLSIEDISGRKIKSTTLRASSGENNAEWNIADVPAGIYLLKLQGKDCFGAYKVVVK